MADSKAKPVKFEPSHKTIQWLFDQDSKDVVGKSFTVKGRIVRAKQIFIQMTDGSSFKPLQLVLNKQKMKSLADSGSLYPCTTISVKGTLRISQNPKAQQYDFDVETISILGKVVEPTTFLPSLPNNMSLDTWREHCDTRFHCPEMKAIFRIRAALSWFTSVFMNEHGVLHLDPEPITGADCEGAGEMFVVTTLLDSKSKATDLPVKHVKKVKSEKDSKDAKDQDQTIKSMINDLIQGLQKPETMSTKELIEKLQSMNELEIKWVKDHFANPDPGRLTCSSQLGLEFMVPAMGPVYCSLPSFRGEKSNTRRHLASFTHMEAELPFISFKDLMDFIEEYVTYCLKSVREECTNELALLKGVTEKLEGFMKEPFGRISYTEAISLLEKNQEALQKAFPEVKVVPKWGEDLGGECERFLSEVMFKKPIFVFNMPLKLKSFYMKKNEGEEKGKETVQGCDLLVPSLGELVGASIRESDYTNLTSEMICRGMFYQSDSEPVTEKLKAEIMIDLDKGLGIDALMAKFKIHFGPLQKYVGLRKNAGTPTGGFGLGFERLVTICTSALDGGNIRDRRPFYAAYQDLQF